MTSTFNLPTVEPTSITANDNVQWLRRFSDYNPVSFTLSYALVPVNGTPVTFSASDYGDGETFWVNIPSSTTKTWTASDNYVGQAYMTDSSSNRLTLYSFPIKVKPDLSSVTSGNYQSTVKQTLDALEATIQGKASADVLRYEIRGRSLEHMSVADITKWYAFYKELYRKEVAESDLLRGKPQHNRMLARFPSYDEGSSEFWRMFHQ